MSRMKICLTCDVAARFARIKTEATGTLFGHIFDGTLVVVGFGLPLPSDNVGNGEVDIELSNAASAGLVNYLPTEIDSCGVVTFGKKCSKDETSADVNKLLQAVDITDNPILISCTSKSIEVHIFINDKLEKMPFKVLTHAELTSTFAFIRLSACIPISFGTSVSSCRESFEELRKKVVENALAFHVPNITTLLTGNEGSDITGEVPDLLLKDIFLPTPPERNKKDLSYAIVPASLFLRQTKELTDSSVPLITPVIHCAKCNMKSLKVLVKIDALSFVHHHTKVTDLYSILISSFYRNLKLIEENAIIQREMDKGKDVSTPELFHFWPGGLGHFLSVVYSHATPDANLQHERLKFHQYLGLPLDQPLFRRSQAFSFDGVGSVKSPLTNPHVGLTSGVKGGEASIVKGLYSYYHYMLDGYDDNGWGCAYRSLQTIISWFRHQGFTEIEVPSHRRIQECLVDIGDKPSSFIGSRQWIGSTEVGFVLETLLGIPCRILTAGTGEEVAYYGSELFYHFQNHGTPVMIGGGVLAHTIIGVDYNRSTGDIKFLILDPHYTGRDDVGIITGKGWVGWKDSKFWDKSAFYNMCLPQKPSGYY